MRRLLLLAIAAMFLAGCGAREPKVQLTIVVTGGLATVAETYELTHTLECDPVGGDMPRREELCRLIAEYPKAMLFPPPARSLCSGGPGMRSFDIEGRAYGRHVARGGLPGCGWPGGQGLHAFAVAMDGLPVPSAEALQLRCDEDPVLLAKPTHWKLVRACLQPLRRRWASRNYERDAETAYRAVMSSRAAERLGLPRLFPRSWTLAAYCRIPKHTVRATCHSFVIRDGDRRIVRLTEVWDSWQLRAHPARRRYLRHIWEFTVSKQLRIVSTRSYGDSPP